MKNNSRIKSLREAIWMVQLEKFTKKFDKMIEKENNETKKWLRIAFLPLCISALLCIITASPFPLIIGTTYFGGVSIYKMIKDGEETERQIRERYNPNPKIRHIGEEESDFLEEPIIAKTEEDFYSDLLRSIIEAPKKPNLKIVGKEKIIENPQEESEEYDTSKEEVMIELVSEYQIYAQAYTLPKFAITNKEWDILFDTMYKRLQELSLENKLYDVMSFLQRYAFAYSLVNKTKEINLNTYLLQLPTLKKVGFSILDVSSIEEEIRSQLKPGKIVNFNAQTLSKK